MNINEEIQKVTDQFVETKLPALVAEKVGKMVDSILEDVFRSYSDTAKQIKTKIEEKLDINLQNFDLLDYNTMVSNAINERLVGIVNDQAIEPIMSLVQGAVGFLEKKTIKLSEIHQMVIEAAQEDSSDDSGSILFNVEEDYEHKWHTVTIGLADDGGPTLYFLISQRNNGRIFCFQAKTTWAEKMGKLTPAKMTQLSNLEHKIFRLYSAQVSVEVDETDFDNYWSKYDY